MNPFPITRHAPRARRRRGSSRPSDRRSALGYLLGSSFGPAKEPTRESVEEADQGPGRGSAHRPDQRTARGPDPQPHRIRRTLRTGSVLALVFALHAAADDAAEGDPAAALLAADRAFAERSAESDARTAFAEFLAPDAILLPRAGEPVEGHAAAIASFGDATGYALLWEPQFAEVAASGELGWTWGRYRVVADGVETSRGKYVNIWKRQPDGRWKVRLDMGNQAPPAAD